MAKRKLKMDILNPNAAGIDIGSRSHLVAINQFGAIKPVSTDIKSDLLAEIKSRAEE